MISPTADNIPLRQRRHTTAWPSAPRMRGFAKRETVINNGKRKIRTLQYIFRIQGDAMTNLICSS